MRHCTCPASQQSAQCACSLGAVTLRGSIFPRTASSAINNPLGTQLQTIWTQQRMGMSTPGLLTLHRRIGSSRCSSASSLSLAASPQPGQATPQPADAGNMPAVPSPAEEQAAGTSRANLGCTLEIQHRVSLGHHQPPLLSPARQASSSPHGNPLPTVPAPLALPDRQAPTIEAQPQHPWTSRSAPACQARGQHPASSNCHWPWVYLQCRCLLPSEGRSCVVSISISLSC